MAQLNNTLLYGINAVRELIIHNSKSVLTLYIEKSRKDKRINEILELAASKHLQIKECSKQELQALLDTDEHLQQAIHQGVVVECKPAEEKDEAFLKALVGRADTPLLLLILDGVTDPHNLGACLRSANAAGADAVIVLKDNAVGLTAIVRKVASGAAEMTPLVVVKNLARCIKQLQEAGVWVMGAAGETDQTLFSLDLTSHTALVMGSEGDGLRRLTRERCDQLFSIPMAGSVESLNVSVAAGVCLFEVLRQRSH